MNNIGYDDRRIAVLGPYVVEHDTPGITDSDGVTLDELSIGLVLGFHVESDEAWDANADTAQLIIRADDGNAAAVGRYAIGSNWGAGGGQQSLSKFVGATAAAVDSGIWSNVGDTCRFTARPSLTARVVNGGSATAGRASIYVVTVVGS